MTHFVEKLTVARCNIRRIMPLSKRIFWLSSPRPEPTKKNGGHKATIRFGVPFSSTITSLVQTLFRKRRFIPADCPHYVSR